ncbi:DNA binding protein [Thioalkalivibrio sp. XN279]|nr:histone-like nucleoid-structuring protein, MvaT/MvaU family [Thioalkalivibrio sp. XN279]NHA15469.1 DNA binding protein [Thioalkalivibrio sp. XN279]
MSQKLKELRAKEAKLAKLTEELKALESDKELKTDLKLRDEIEALLKKHNRSPAILAELFDLKGGRGPGKGAGGGRGRAAGAGPVRKRRRRKLKVYTNPVTGEVVKTRGANHKVLKTWKAEHGAETVESWAKTEE